MNVRVRWREECVYERVVEIDDDDWEGASLSGQSDVMDEYVRVLATEAVIDQADYLADIYSCEDREILDIWVEEP